MYIAKKNGNPYDYTEAINFKEDLLSENAESWI